jgi:hypothetical protein
VDTEPHHIVAQIAQGVGGRVVVPLADDVSVPPWRPCSDLSLVDVVPLDPREVVPDAPARFWIGHAAMMWTVTPLP